MDNKKFEQLIELIINEDEEKAKALFHDIVVEKSREIYESMITVEMSDSMDDEATEGQDQVGGMLDEIGAEEEGLGEDDDEFSDIEVDDGEDTELNADDLEGDEGAEGDLEDRVVDLEDKLDQLMAEFEEMMGDEGGEEGGEEFGGEEGGEEDEEGLGEEVMEGEDDEEELDEAEEDDEEEETLEEAVQLQKVSVTHGDNGQNTKSVVSSGPKVSGNGASAANLNKGGDGGKGGTNGGLLNPATKDLKGAGQFKNAPGNKGMDLSAAPKPKHGDNGQNTKSIVGESKKIVKKIVKK